MLEPNGRQVLRLIGKEPTAQGIIEVQDMPSAIKALQQAIETEAALQHGQNHATNPAQQNEQADQSTQDQDDSLHDRVGLKQRALPFMDMLQRAHAVGKDIVWGV
jgi:hypothetical protein